MSRAQPITATHTDVCWKCATVCGMMSKAPLSPPSHQTQSLMFPRSCFGMWGIATLARPHSVP